MGPAGGLERGVYPDAPGWLNDYLAPLAAKAANTLLPIGYVALIVEMFRAQRVYLQTEEQ